MKVLITGGTGFLGRRLTQELLKRGDIELHVFSRNNISGHSGVSYHKADIGNKEEVEGLVTTLRPDWVFHLASDIRRGREEALYHQMLRTNTEGTLNILSASAKAGARALVSAGTFEEYGNVPVPFEEDGPVNPASAYGVSKVSASLLTASYGKKIMPATVLRFPVIYGEGQIQISFMTKMKEALDNGTVFPISPGDQTREFLHVDDVIRALISAAENISACRGEIINVCPGEEIPLVEVGNLIAKVTGRDDFFKFGADTHRQDEQMRYFGANRKMKEILGFTPQVSLEEGLKKFFQK